MRGADDLKKSLVILTTEALMDYIEKNELKVGDKLPNEYDMSSLLDVSRSTLREAIRVLVSRNILEVRKGSGSYISAKKGVTDDPLGFSLINDTFKLTEDLFQVRYILEPHVAAEAALRATDKDLKELKKVKEAIEETVGEESTRHFELDIQFHSIIARASKNVAMNHLVPVINKSIWLYNDFYTSQESKKDMVKLHNQIYRAIKEKDPIAADEAMTLHIAQVRQSLKEHNEENKKKSK